MNFSELDNELKKQVYKYEEITREVNPLSIDECTRQIVSTVISACNNLIKDKELLKDQLISEGKDIVNRIIEKEDMLEDESAAGYADTDSRRQELEKVLVPPYKQSLKKLEDRLNVIDEVYNKRLALHNEMINEIYIIGSQINRDIPPISRSLSLANMEQLESLKREFTEEKQSRLKERDELEAKFNSMRKFLNITNDLENYDDLSVSTLEKFRAYIDEVNVAYESRKSHIDGLLSKINRLCDMLEVTCELGDPNDGSDERVTFLENKERELDDLKKDRLNMLIPRYIEQLHDLWENLFLDLSLRRNFDSKDYSFENLYAIESEVSKMDEMMRDPERSVILKKIHEYRDIRITEGELKKAQKDPQRYTRRGFMDYIKKENLVRSRVAQTKPIVVRELLDMILKWQENHSGESFYLSNADDIENLSVTLQEELNRSETHSTRTQKTIKQTAQPQVIPTVPGRRPIGVDRKKNMVAANAVAADARKASASVAARAVRPVKPVRPQVESTRAVPGNSRHIPLPNRTQPRSRSMVNIPQTVSNPNLVSIRSSRPARQQVRSSGSPLQRMPDGSASSSPSSSGSSISIGRVASAIASNTTSATLKSRNTAHPVHNVASQAQPYTLRRRVLPNKTLNPQSRNNGRVEKRHEVQQHISTRNQAEIVGRIALSDATNRLESERAARSRVDKDVPNNFTEAIQENVSERSIDNKETQPQKAVIPPPNWNTENIAIPDMSYFDESAAEFSYGRDVF